MPIVQEAAVEVDETGIEVPINMIVEVTVLPDRLLLRQTVNTVGVSTHL